MALECLAFPRAQGPRAATRFATGAPLLERCGLRFGDPTEPPAEDEAIAARRAARKGSAARSVARPSGQDRGLGGRRERDTNRLAHDDLDVVVGFACGQPLRPMGLAHAPCGAMTLISLKWPRSALTSAVRWPTNGLRRHRDGRLSFEMLIRQHHLGVFDAVGAPSTLTVIAYWYWLTSSDAAGRERHASSAPTSIVTLGRRTGARGPEVSLSVRA
jgi:hypothetical protein